MCDDKMNSCGGHEGAGSCGSHHGCCGWGHKSWLRVLLALLVLGFVFCAGVKFGMLKAYFGGWDRGYRGYPYPLMMNGNAGYGYGMMQGWVEASKEATTTKK